MSRPRRVAAVAGYAAAVVVGLALWADRPHLDRRPVVLEACAAALVGVPASYRRYRDTVGPERQRLQWLGCAVAVLPRWPWCCWPSGSWSAGPTGLASRWWP